MLEFHYSLCLCGFIVFIKYRTFSLLFPQIFCPSILNLSHSLVMFSHFFFLSNFGYFLLLSLLLLIFCNVYSAIHMLFIFYFFHFRHYSLSRSIRIVPSMFLLNILNLPCTILVFETESLFVA
jgi:hypothetical protein